MFKEEEGGRNRGRRFTVACSTYDQCAIMHTCIQYMLSRFRAVVTGNVTLRPYGQQLLKLFCSWDRKSLEHTLSSYFG